MTKPQPEQPPLQIRPQEDNANAHTERGMQELERSIDQYGWLDSITVAADGEAISGSGRLEKWAEKGMPEPIYVRHDGTRPIVGVRVDIPSANDPRAKAAAVAMNRTAQLNLQWIPERVTALDEQNLLLPGLFYAPELEALRPPEDHTATAPPGQGGDEFLLNPRIETPSRARRGDVWQIGRHRLMCGDARQPYDLDALLEPHAGKADLLITDPPYNVGKVYEDGIRDDLDSEEYAEFIGRWFSLWSRITRKQIVTPGYDMFPLWMQKYPPFHYAPWTELNSMTHGNITKFFCWEPILFYGAGQKWERRRANNVFDHPLSVQRFATGESMTGIHPCPKPLALITDFIENFTDPGDILADPFAGTGTLMVGAHRTGRTAVMMELSPRYCDVILSRALAEGIGPLERVYTEETEVVEVG